MYGTTILSVCDEQIEYVAKEGTDIEQWILRRQDSIRKIDNIGESYQVTREKYDISFTPCLYGLDRGGS